MSEFFFSPYHLERIFFFGEEKPPNGTETVNRVPRGVPDDTDSKCAGVSRENQLFGCNFAEVPVSLRSIRGAFRETARDRGRVLNENQRTE